MAGRWRDPSAFRADPAATPALHPSRRQTVALLAVLALVAGAVTLLSYLVRPERARAFDLFHGSLFLADQNSPVAVDLASGKPTIRLHGADQQVGLNSSTELGVVPMTDGTLLLNETTGEFNMVDNSGFVVKLTGGGVPLAPRSGVTSSFALATADGQAYVVRTGASGGTDVYLVNEPTVESAIDATKSVTPRASTTMPAPVSTAPGGAVSANSDLWLLTGAGGRQTVRELAVPADSNPGAALRISDHGTVSGPAALGSAVAPDGTDVVGLATAGSIELLPRSGPASTVRFTAPPGVDQVVPASNAQGRLSFLLHGTDGWSVVSVETSGAGLHSPRTLAGVSGAARLIPPAQSNGSLYTLDASTGQIIVIDANGQAGAVRGAAGYPVSELDGRAVETTDFSDTDVTGRGSRIVFNSPTHANALMLFTDNSRGPDTIEKNSAVDINAAGGAEALAKSTANPNQQPGKQTGPPGVKPKPTDIAPINNRVNCKTVKQQPHIPVLSGVPGSRSVALSWTYPILSNQDCYPSTYVISVKLISNNAPQPPSSVTVQSQTGTVLAGLFPSTEYQITVTAYINGVGTPSLPILVTTGPEGPAAPTGISVTADSSGNWTVNWNSCGGVAQGCVPAQDWTITPSFCDGRGLSSPPTPITKTADPTAQAQGPAVYSGSDNLLGRGLQFQVMGSGDQGQAGTPSAESACVYSWSPPVAGDLSLNASQPATGSGATTVTLSLGNDPVRAVGGVGASVQLYVDDSSGNQVDSKTVTYDGSSSAESATFSNLTLGAQYAAYAVVTAPGHSGASVTLGPKPVTTAANWPGGMQVAASCPSDGSFLQLSCVLSVQVTGLTEAQANNESFNFVDSNGSDSELDCDVGTLPLDRSDGGPIDSTFTKKLSLFNYSGNCTVTLYVQEANLSGTPLYGGQIHEVTSPQFTIAGAPTLGAKKTDFTVGWDTNNSSVSAARVTYVGTHTDQEVGNVTQGWSEILTAPDGTTCDNDPQAQPTSSGIDVTASSTCVNQQGSTSGWKLTLSYQDANTTNTHSFTYTISGTPPGYQPCTFSTKVAGAAWGATKADGVDVTTTAKASDLAGCSAWGYQLSDKSGNAVCASSTTGVTAAPPTNISLTTCATPLDATWTLTISWTDTAGNTHTSDPIDITGTPPTS